VPADTGRAATLRRIVELPGENIEMKSNYDWTTAIQNAKISVHDIEVG